LKRRRTNIRKRKLQLTGPDIKWSGAVCVGVELMMGEINTEIIISLFHRAFFNSNMYKTPTHALYLI